MDSNLLENETDFIPQAVANQMWFWRDRQLFKNKAQAQLILFIMICSIWLQGKVKALYLLKWNVMAQWGGGKSRIHMPDEVANR